MSIPHDNEPIYEIETLANPREYSALQIAFAGWFAAYLDRGKLVLCEPPTETD